jgi:hypothetical protein
MRLIDPELQLKLHLFGDLVVPVVLCWLLVLAESISARFGGRAREGRPVTAMATRENRQLWPERSGRTSTRI